MAVEHLDVPNLEKEIVKLETQSSQPGFWEDQNKAQGLMRQLADKKKTVEQWRGLEKKLADAAELISVSEEDAAMQQELTKELDTLSTQIDELEFRLAFSGEYDARDAIITIHAGAGGTESQDWAEMLLRMYLRWAERRGFKTEILDTSPGDEAGIKKVVIYVKGEYAAGYLKSEHGVHRLVRLSPFDSDHARHTSFALVEVLPEAESDIEVNIKPEDIKIETFRSSGPGGQHMQKTSSAVRITHLPSGTIVSCQSERSQHMNKDYALKILRARLLDLEIEKQEAAKARLKGKRIDAGWGSQIRSYVLHPYRMVKDHRTDFETSNTEAVLDGELDSFINAYLRSIMGKRE
ncbi:MAG: peptide chain release factor 2 [Dehalococcoidales bacterium]|nr:peptide chain release factor 2 [Dehalococcoidales bacterium]